MKRNVISFLYNAYSCIALLRTLMFSLTLAKIEEFLRITFMQKSVGSLDIIQISRGNGGFLDLFSANRTSQLAETLSL